ncbi:hypothetical protein D3C85_1214930 [compost metagenome]
MVADRHQPIGHVDRLGQRHVHLPEDLQGVGAFHAGRFFQFARHRLEGLAQQEDAEGRCEVRQADGEHRVADAKLAHRTVVLHQQHVRHDHELQQHQHEDEIAAAEFEAGERIAGQGRQDELRGQHHRHQHEGVEEVPRERRRFPGAHEVVQRQRREQVKAGRVGGRMERRPHGVGQGQDPQQAQRPGAQGIELVFH